MREMAEEGEEGGRGIFLPHSIARLLVFLLFWSFGVMIMDEF